VLAGSGLSDAVWLDYAEAPCINQTNAHSSIYRIEDFDGSVGNSYQIRHAQIGACVRRELFCREWALCFFTEECESQIGSEYDCGRRSKRIAIGLFYSGYKMT